jgi:hypothetical protein
VWTGKQGHGAPGGGFTADARSVQWTVSLGGTSATGPFVIGANVAGNTVNVSGTLAMTFSGIQVTFTETFPAGAFAAAGSSTCSSTGTGSGTWSPGTTEPRTAASINATMQLTYDQSCVSLLGLSGTADFAQLVLTQ